MQLWKSAIHIPEIQAKVYKVNRYQDILKEFCCVNLYLFFITMIAASVTFFGLKTDPFSISIKFLTIAGSIIGVIAVIGILSSLYAYYQNKKEREEIEGTQSKQILNDLKKRWINFQIKNLERVKEAIPKDIEKLTKELESISNE